MNFKDFIEGSQHDRIAQKYIEKKKAKDAQNIDVEIAKTTTSLANKIKSLKELIEHVYYFKHELSNDEMIEAEDIYNEEIRVIQKMSLALENLMVKIRVQVGDEPAAAYENLAKSLVSQLPFEWEEFFSLANKFNGGYEERLSFLDKIIVKHQDSLKSMGDGGHGFGNMGWTLSHPAVSAPSQFSTMSDVGWSGGVPTTQQDLDDMRKSYGKILTKTGKSTYSWQPGTEALPSLMKHFDTNKDGAGILVVAKHTYDYFGKNKPILICKRSKNMRDGLTWGSWGGLIESGETPLQAALAEFKEESGYTGKIKIVSNGYKKTDLNGFMYHNYLGLVDHQFVPNMQKWEVADYDWVSYEELIAIPKAEGKTLSDRKKGTHPGHMHWGLAEYLTVKGDIVKNLAEKSMYVVE